MLQRHAETRSGPVRHVVSAAPLPSDRDVLLALRFHWGPEEVRERLGRRNAFLSKLYSGYQRVPPGLGVAIRTLAAQHGIVDGAGTVACRFCPVRLPLGEGWPDALRTHEALEHVPPAADVVLENPWAVRQIVSLVRELVGLPNHAHRVRRRIHDRLRSALCDASPPPRRRA